MTVYVDNMLRRYRRMLMCHMLADTDDELHAMADRIGIDRKWFQKNASTPHYDVCKEKRDLALKHGAMLVDRRELVKVIQAKRERQ